MQIFSIDFVIINPRKKANKLTIIKPYKTFFHSSKLMPDILPFKAIAAPDIPAINACDWLVGIPILWKAFHNIGYRNYFIMESYMI